MDDDSLGDLADVMGDDYHHGANFDDGDPNIKPVTPPAPQSVGKGHGTKIRVKFPAQKQFLTKLVVQALPLSAIPSGDPAHPEAWTHFKESRPDCRIVQPKEPMDAQDATFEKLNPQSGYIFRLVVTNPSGTAYGKPSKPLFTLPRTPPAPEFAYASAKALSIKFEAQGPGLSKLAIEMAVFCADPFSPDNKKKGLLTDTSAQINTRTAGLIKNLKGGVSYVFRLHVTNEAGTVVGPQSKPMKCLPRMPVAPREDVTGRSDTTIKLRWKPLGAEITKLVMQYAILNGKNTFVDVKKNGGKDCVLADPQSIESYVVKRLKPDTDYVFRLIAYNASGKSTGAMCGPIKTVTFSPDMLDKSGWLFQVNAGAKKARRASFKKEASPRYWYTIDGKLLTWSTDVDGTEVDYLHLGKVAKIEVQSAEVIISLKATGAGKKKSTRVICLRAFTDDPNTDDEAAAAGWVNALVKALKGEKAVHAEMKKISAVKAVIAGDDELDAIDGVDESEDEEGGFGENDGFGDDFDDSEDEDEGGFGEESEDEDEDEGGFGDDSEEEEEASGFD